MFGCPPASCMILSALNSCMNSSWSIVSLSTWHSVGSVRYEQYSHLFKSTFFTDFIPRKHCRRSSRFGKHFTFSVKVISEIWILMDTVPAYERVLALCTARRQRTDCTGVDIITPHKLYQLLWPKVRFMLEYFLHTVSKCFLRVLDSCAAGNHRLKCLTKTNTRGSRRCSRQRFQRFIYVSSFS